MLVASHESNILASYFHLQRSPLKRVFQPSSGYLISQENYVTDSAASNHHLGPINDKFIVRPYIMYTSSLNITTRRVFGKYHLLMSGLRENSARSCWLVGSFVSLIRMKRRTVTKLALSSPTAISSASCRWAVSISAYLASQSGGRVEQREQPLRV